MTTYHCNRCNAVRYHTGRCQNEACRSPEFRMIQEEAHHGHESRRGPEPGPEAAGQANAVRCRTSSAAG